MVQIEFGLDHYHLNNKMGQFCFDNFGQGGWYQSSITEGRRWAWDSVFGHTTYYFADEKDAAWFILNWPNNG